MFQDMGCALLALSFFARFGGAKIPLSRRLLFALAAVMVHRVFRRVVRLVASVACRSSQKALPLLPPTPDSEELQRLRDSVIDMGSLPVATSYEESVGRLIRFIRQDHFQVSDLLRQNSSKIMVLHKEVAADVPGGVAVRLTVQYNLFSGTIANLGSDDQRTLLASILKNGEVGCFALTEAGPGVLSGLVVDTVATWTNDGYTFVTPSESARKVWISQGLTAQWCVVIARLVLPSGDKGPHAFLISLMGVEGRRGSRASPQADVKVPPKDQEATILLGDMEEKTTFNDLDNATLSFKGFTVPHTSLLCGVSYVDDNGAYQLRNPNVPFSFEIVAQRLLSGRLCIAGAALLHVDRMFNTIRQNYKRQSTIGKDLTTPFVDMPFIYDFELHHRAVVRCLRAFGRRIEKEFAEAAQLSPALVERIACCKVVFCTFAIDVTMAYKKQVGSLSLMSSSPFGSQNDILYCFQFAEGDANILKQKIARDCLQALAKNQVAALLLMAKDRLGLAENSVVQRHHSALVKLAQVASKARREDRMKVWLNSHPLVEEVASTRCVMVIRNMLVRDPHVPATDLLEFDKHFNVRTVC